MSQKTNQTAQCAWRLGDPRQNCSYVELRGRSNSRLSEAAPGRREGARRNGTETYVQRVFDPFGRRPGDLDQHLEEPSQPVMRRDRQQGECFSRPADRR